VGGDVEETVAASEAAPFPSPSADAACAVEKARRAVAARRSTRIAVVRDGRTLLDCRTLTDAEVEEVAAAVTTARPDRAGDGRDAGHIDHGRRGSYDR
jgi:hypothetical protein